MKIRNGFISNSSSSSFIVIAPKGYKFGDNIPYEDMKHFFLSKEEMVEIFNDAFYSEQVNVLGQEGEVYTGYSSDDGGCYNIIESDLFHEKFGEHKDMYSIADGLYGKFTDYFKDKDGCYVKRDYD